MDLKPRWLATGGRGFPAAGLLVLSSLAGRPHTKGQDPMPEESLHPKIVQLFTRLARNRAAWRDLFDETLDADGEKIAVGAYDKTALRQPPPDFHTFLQWWTRRYGRTHLTPGALTYAKHHGLVNAPPWEQKQTDSGAHTAPPEGWLTTKEAVNRHPKLNQNALCKGCQRRNLENVSISGVLYIHPDDLVRYAEEFKGRT